jgi:hypothetical protein
MDLVMQVVHDYGRNHQASVLPPPSPIPQETESEYMAKIKEALLESDFAQLEKTAQQNRTERGLLRGGTWKINAFYNQSAGPMNSGEETDEGYQNEITRLNQWITAYPDSVTPASRWLVFLRTTPFSHAAKSPLTAFPSPGGSSTTNEISRPSSIFSRLLT